MNTRFLIAIALLGLLTGGRLYAQSKAGKILMSYQLAMGRLPTVSDMNGWINAPEKSVAEYVAIHKSWLQGQPYEARQVISRGYFDAFGFQPAQPEYDYWMKIKPTYAELFEANINFMNGQSDSQKAKKMLTINAAFLNVWGRNPGQNEFNQWMAKSTMAYGRLLAMLRTMKDTGQPNNVMCGTTSGSISTYAISEPLANECQRVPGGSAVVNKMDSKLIDPSKAPIISQDGGGLVASGGGNLVASGGGNLVASGGGNLTSAR